MFPLYVLIETSWNVKKFDKKYFHQNTLVLIETSWNVKNSETELVEFLKEVLIETSWNVKDGKGSDYWIGDICINRNIVECKVEESYKARTLASCINRNIVECKGNKIVVKLDSCGQY